MKFNTFMKGGMAAVMAMSLAACSGSSGNGGSAKSGSSDAFKLGGSAPLTGAASIYGQAVNNAVKIAVQEINDSDDYDFKFELPNKDGLEDDAHDTKQAASAYDKLKDWGMQVSTYTVTSAPAAAVASKYHDDNIFAITPSGSSTDAIQDKKGKAYGNLFQMCFTDPNQGTASAEYIGEHKLGTKVAVIYNNKDNYSTGIYNNFEKAASKNGLDIVDTETFTDDNKTDMSVQVQKVKASGAEVVFLPIYYDAAANILKEANTQGLTAKFFGCDGMDGILDVDGFDTKLAEGLYMLTPFSADSTEAKTKAFVDKYEKDYDGEVPNQFAADAYDSVYAIAQAIKETGVKPSDDASTICDALKKEFPKMKFHGITADGDITWNKDGEVSKAPRAVVIKDGKYVSAE